MNQIRPIVELGDPRLRQEAEVVQCVLADTVINIISDMKATLTSTEGVGLAAPQIGASYQIIIIGSRPTGRYPLAPQMDPIVMLNPKFIATSDDCEKDWEGCLSIPGIRALVPRHTNIQVDFQDTSGSWQQLNLSGFIARVFQHEFDHLIGHVYLDRVESSHDIVTEKSFQELYL